jgi:hypothetical protein
LCYKDDRNESDVSDGIKMESLAKKRKFCEEVAVAEPHSKWKNGASESNVPDYLKLLYPHDRDGDCFMEEAEHKYYVHNLPYAYSVSDVWKLFFPEFDDTMTIQTCLAKSQNLGLMNLESSAYNLYLFLIYFKRMSPGDETFWNAVNEVCVSAKQHASRAWCMSSNDSLDDAITHAVQDVITSPRKPVGRSCYFLSFCAGCCFSSLKATWSFNGDLESFKGKFLHKQAECYMQRLAQWQHENNKTHVRLGDMFCDTKVMEAVHAACRPSAIMRKLAPTTSASLWNHPATQRWLQEQLGSCCSPELYRFFAWTYANPNLTPFRSEWSIYNEDFQVGGQIDSLWLDTAKDNAIVMADWKRAKNVLSADPDVHRQQSWGKCGLERCVHSKLPGPCRYMFDCASIHYLAQQNLYAHFLAMKYNMSVDQMLLVQCHPSIGETLKSFNEVVFKYDAAFSESLLVAFASGWKHAHNIAEPASVPIPI